MNRLSAIKCFHLIMKHSKNWSHQICLDIGVFGEALFAELNTDVRLSFHDDGQCFWAGHPATNFSGKKDPLAQIMRRDNAPR